MAARRRNRFKFTEKRHSKRGVISTVLAIGSLLAYLFFVQKAFAHQGQLSTYYGSAGLFCMMISLVALVLGFMSLGEEDSFPVFKRTAVISSLVSAGCWIATYVVGFTL